MLPLIEQHKQQIAELCQKYAVRRLDLFGSAARGDFNAAGSDIDFFVEFLDYTSPAIADQWFGLQEELHRLLGAPVELVSARVDHNPYFLQVAQRHRVTLYAA